jgi:hypothetical protein
MGFSAAVVALLHPSTTAANEVCIHVKPEKGSCKRDSSEQLAASAGFHFASPAAICKGIRRRPNQPSPSLAASRAKEGKRRRWPHADDRCTPFPSTPAPRPPHRSVFFTYLMSILVAIKILLPDLWVRKAL